MALDDEIKIRRQEISTDAYGMSVGEMIGLYRDRELNLHPDFQRFFRWTASQKSRLIESLLLGIPIPPIFVSQDEQGKWDVIDGLQRLSTILELTGDLRGEDGALKQPLILTQTNYLPSLQGKRWKTDPEGGPDELTEAAKLQIKRARLDLKIVLNTSDKSSKFELFDRLNTGGTQATDQEVRNCILLMVNKPFFEKLASLGADENFKTCLPLTDRQREEQYDLELVVRFITLRLISEEQLAAIVDIGPFLTRSIVEKARDEHFDWDQEERAFRTTFKILAETHGEDSFRKFDVSKDKPVGPPLISLFEFIAIGIGHHASGPNYKIDPDRVTKAQVEVWTNGGFTAGTGSGIRATTRMPVTIPLGRLRFAP